jgi:hypothetical protein
MAQRKEILENLSPEQSEALEKAAFLIISAQKEAKEKAKAMLRRARIPDDWFGSPCTAHIGGSATAHVAITRATADRVRGRSPSILSPSPSPLILAAIKHPNICPRNITNGCVSRGTPAVAFLRLR